MPTEVRYCRECRAMTTHVVVRRKDLTAHLCQQCLLQLATQLEVTEKPVRGRLAPSVGRTNLNANSKGRSETQDKDRVL